ncbi:MAG: protein kinase [Kiritimatiellae bacterium]|nr:protein kinase [Kiritimatiellia bacterium]
MRKLGGGGFGVVYLAHDTSGDIDVAIKTLHPLLKRNTEEMEKLRDKFKLVSNLAHSNIASPLVLLPCREIAIHDPEARRELDLSPGDAVMVMRYAPGVTLSKWRKQFTNGIVPFKEVCEIGKQVASALDYAHREEHIVHRDIKPANIMVETQEGGKIRIRILDFGLAAEIRASMSRVSMETCDTSGTRPYMAPEQWSGRFQNGNTDQYALACVLFELLSGAPPFAGVFETGDPAIMRSAVQSEPPPTLPGLSPAANAAFARALAKSPDARFPSCEEFIAALGKALFEAPPSGARRFFDAGRSFFVNRNSTRRDSSPTADSVHSASTTNSNAPIDTQPPSGPVKPPRPKWLPIAAVAVIVLLMYFLFRGSDARPVEEPTPDVTVNMHSEENDKSYLIEIEKKERLEKWKDEAKIVSESISYYSKWTEHPYSSRFERAHDAIKTILAATTAPTPMAEAEKAIEDLRSLKSWMDEKSKIREDFEARCLDVETKLGKLVKDEYADAAADVIKIAQDSIAQAKGIRDSGDYDSALKALAEANGLMPRAEEKINDKRRANEEALAQLTEIKRDASAKIQGSQNLLARWNDKAWSDRAEAIKSAATTIVRSSAPEDIPAAKKALDAISTEVKWMNDNSVSRQTLDNVEKEMRELLNGLSPTVRKYANREFSNAESLRNEAEKLREAGKYPESAEKSRKAKENYSRAKNMADYVEKRLTRIEIAKRAGAADAAAMSCYEWGDMVWKAKKDEVEAAAKKLAKCADADDAENAENLRNNIGEALSWAKKNDSVCRQIDDMQKQLDALNKEAKRIDIAGIRPVSESSAIALLEKSSENRKTGKFPEAKADLEKAIEILTKAVSETKAERAARGLRLARDFANQGKWRECLDAANFVMENWDSTNAEVQALAKKAHENLHSLK